MLFNTDMLDVFSEIELPGAAKHVSLYPALHKEINAKKINIRAAYHPTASQYKPETVVDYYIEHLLMEDIRHRCVGIGSKTYYLPQ